jgi:glycosyltransferase involved in cell wall biosynthesis
MAAELGPVAIQRIYRRVAWLRHAMRGQDLVLSCLTKINVQTAVAAVGLNLRRIASERNNFLKQRMNGVWRWTMPLALSSADAIVMQTAAARDALPRWARRHARVIANPVLPHTACRQATPKPGIVAVGRLNEQKGFDILLRALRIARDQGHSMPLKLYGAGKQENALKELARSLEVQDLVAFVGRSSVPHDWAREPGIFVLSSRFEGFPNVLIEAMASGFAVLATRCDWGPSEIVTPDVDGLLIPTEDPAAMAEGLIRLHQDASLRRRLALAAQERAKDFAEHRIMAQWERAILDVLGPRAEKPSGKAGRA